MRKSIATSLAAVCATLTLAAGAALAALPAPVEKALGRHGLSQDSLSIHVTDPATGETILSHLADTPRNPASAMKLVTTYAALDLLGPNFAWRTGFFVDSPIEQGILNGNLYLRGGGDPMILVEDFLRALYMLRQLGLEEIRGDLVVDETFFDTDTLDTTPIDRQPYRAYHAWPAALVINFRATRFLFVPGDDAVDIVADPPADTLEIDNGLRLVDGPCRGLHRAVSVQVTPRDAGARVRFSGDYPRRCGERELTRSVLGQDEYLLGVFRSLWRMLGGEISGKLVHGPVPGDARMLFERTSRPLAEILQGVNKYSNNLMARALLLTLGAELYGAPGTVEAGRVAVRSWLNDRSLIMPGLIIDNGAGLSRDARLTARGLAGLLEDALSHPFRDEYLASLSLVGIDGSTRKRLVNGEQAGRYRLKTGLLTGVRAAAGYGLTRRGTRLVVVILQDASNLDYASGNAVQDALLTWLHENY